MLSMRRIGFLYDCRAMLRFCLILLCISTSGAVINCGAHAERFANVKVQFVNSSVGWIVGPRLLRTTDGGHTWAVVSQDDAATFKVEDIFIARQKIQFIDQSTGWTLGGGGINRTSDGGRTWSSTNITSGRDYSLQSLFFVSPNEGWVVGAHVYHTSDGGRHWQQLSNTPVGEPQRQSDMRISEENANYNPSLWFNNRGYGLMARLDGEVYATTDGGRAWNKIWTVDRKIEDIFFVNAQHGWMVGSKGFVARTSDGGHTWASVQTPAAEDTLTSIFFLSEQDGWAVGYNGTILYTQDGGMHWKKAAITGLSNPSVTLASVSFADERHGWAVGGYNNPNTSSVSGPTGVVVFTDDGGQTWHQSQL